MKARPQFDVVMLAKGKARVEIYDTIGPSWLGMIDAKLVARELKAAGDDALEEIEVRINSPGGNVYDALAIHNLLKDHPARVNVVIDGLAASAATMVAMAGDNVRIPKNALMFLHEPATFVFGTKTDLKRALETLAVVESSVIETYKTKTQQPESVIAKWMKDETWFMGQEAVDAGLADTTDKELETPPAPSKAAAAEMFSRAKGDPESLFAVAMKVPSSTKEPPMATTPAPVASQNQPPPQPPPDPTPPPKPAPTPTEPTPEGDEDDQPKQLTPADVTAAANTAATAAVKAERERGVAIRAVCAKAGKPEMADDFIANGTALLDVQNRMFDVLCAARPPIGDAGGKPEPTKDPDKAWKDEFAADRVAMEKAGITEEEYVESRRITEMHRGELPKPQATKAHAA